MPRSPDFRRAKSIVELIGEPRSPIPKPDTGWFKVGATSHGIGFTNGVDHAGTVSGITNAPVSWYLTENGDVRIRGKASNIEAGSVMFQLPTETRPEYAETFICPIDDDGNIDLSQIRFRAFEQGDVDRG